MLLRSITLHNVRSYDLASFEFDQNVTLILGPNGSGKTTILEAVYYLMRGTSFRGRDRDVIPYAHEASELKLELDDMPVRRGRLGSNEEGRVVKSFTVADANSARLAPKDKLPVVLFEPDELRLLSSSPQRRRDFVDGIIGRLSPTYSTVLSRFQRTLLQRNELLKQIGKVEDTSQIASFSGRSVASEFTSDASGGVEPLLNQLFAWDVKLSELSGSIIKARANFIVHANEHLSRIYSQLAGSQHDVTGRYVTPFNIIDDSLQQSLLNRLETSRRLDSKRGFTSVGPHRDDVELSLDSHLASESASRGEMRTIMLAFKLLEVELQEHHSGKKPLILLDDVFSELDSSREQALIKALAPYQTIITATDLRDELKSDAKIISLT